MTDLQGAIGLVQLKKLPAFIEERHGWAAYYDDALRDVDWLRTPVVPDGFRHGWQSYVCLVDETTAPLPRNELMAQLHAGGVSTRPGTHAVHMLSYYREKYGILPDDFPGAQLCERSSISIPLHNRMSADDYHYVVKSIRETT